MQGECQSDAEDEGEGESEAEARRGGLDATGRYSKFAPAADEHDDDKAFRQAMMQNMKKYNAERRAKGPVGNAAANSYMDFLGR